MYQNYRRNAKTKIKLEWVPGPRKVQTPCDGATVDAHIAEQAGVYILAHKDTDGNYQSFYVGQANNLRRRLKEHLLAGEPNACIRNRVASPCGFQYALVARPVHRDAAEAAIYHAHSDWYPCNDPDSVPPSNPDYDVEIGF